MELDPRICYRVLRSRDARFDGRFFTGVTSTGVYCRPVCPAPTPRLENCRFYACAAAAQEAGFRPCRRCRPETSPGTPAWIGTSGTVSRALRLISEGALDEGPVDHLAARLGVGERHLRRLFLRHLGTSPLAVAQTQRVLFAKKLLDETDLALVQVAMSAGFASVRRFNDAMRTTYGRTPSELRRARRGGGAERAPRRSGGVPQRARRGDGARERARRRGLPPGAARRRGAAANGSRSEIVLRLPYRPPFHWPALVGFLAARAIPGVESGGPEHWMRTVSIDGRHGLVLVRPVPGRHELAAHLWLDDARLLLQVTARLRRLFDLGADPDAIATHLAADARLAPLVARFPGLRVPGAWDGFESAVRAILGQQVSVRAATTLAGRIAARFGEPLESSGVGAADAGGLRFVFPTAPVLAHADLTTVGVTRARAAAVRALAAAVAGGRLALDATQDLEPAIEALCALPGIGPWTAHVIAMRALREPDAFPAGDLGLRQALASNGRPATPAGVEKAAEAWRPWRAYAAVYLWQALAPAATVGAARRARTS
jgi:AraC family transcriptional regulator of adaptative response / DNA-3-methyladenine glycosylase II